MLSENLKPDNTVLNIPTSQIDQIDWNSAETNALQFSNLGTVNKFLLKRI